jgi:hypothetical protein
MINRSLSASLPTVNTPLTAFGCVVNEIMRCWCNRHINLTYSTREPATRGDRSGATAFSSYTSSGDRNKDGDADSWYERATSAGSTLTNGMMFNSLGSDTRDATNGVTADGEDEKSDVRGKVGTTD